MFGGGGYNIFSVMNNIVFMLIQQLSLLHQTLFKPQNKYWARLV